MNMTTRLPAGSGTGPSPRATLAAALLGFFVITLDAVIVNVTLPVMGHELAAGVAGLQWIVDGYTLMFASLLLSAGSLSDRVGARRAFGGGVVAFVVASLLCGFAPGLRILIAARFLQGAAAAVMMPSSMALIGQAFPDRVARGRAVALWAMGGSVAATSGPVIGGLLATIDWRWIFFINLPVGAVALLLLGRAGRSPVRSVPIDWTGQMTGALAMAALTYGAIEAGSHGLGAGHVLASLVVAVLALAAFVIAQRRGDHPMVPPRLFEERNAAIAMAVGFAFMVGYFGLPFLMSLYLQQLRGLSALSTGQVFLPMMAVGLVLTPFSARLVERFGARTLIVTGLSSMTLGLVLIAALPSTAPIAEISLLMMLTGLAGPLVAPPVAAVLLNSVPMQLAGTASGAYNTSRQVGGALAVAVFGALLNQAPNFQTGMRSSLVLGSVVAMAAALASLRLSALRPVSQQVA